MPLALSSRDTGRYWLKSDRARDDKGVELPYEKQPTGNPHFILRHLSGREQRELAAWLDKIEDGTATSSAEYMDQIFAKLREMDLVKGWNLIGRDGKAIPFDVADLDFALQRSEALELIYAAWRGGLTAGDVGNLDSPSSSATVASASPADAKPA